jgi:CheY-like chemotaxis protein
MPSRQHLLVVDDQRLDRAIATHAATQVGLRVTGAASIAETRDLLERGGRFDFVVLDLSLGSEDGLEVLSLIASFNRTAVVVLASGFDGRILAASERLAACGFAGGGRVAQTDPAHGVATAAAPAAAQPVGRCQRDPVDSAGTNPPRAGRRAHKTWFQPKASLLTGAIVGAEALARWVRADGQSVSPDAFIPVAEESGLISLLTDTILDQALTACAHCRHGQYARSHRQDL